MINKQHMISKRDLPGTRFVTIGTDTQENSGP
jgi:hypothetical protein